MADKKVYNLEDILAEYDKKRVPNQMPSINSTVPKKQFDNITSAVKPSPTDFYPTNNKPKPTATQPKPTATQARPTATQAKPTAPQPKPTAPQAKPTVPQPKPTAPQAKPTVPQAKPTAPQARPTAPQPKPTAPQPKPTTPQAKPTAPQPKPTAPQAKPTATQAKPTATQAKPTEKKIVKKTYNDDEIRVKSNSPLKLKIEQYTFLFKQLVKRDFNGRYKRTALGVLWSMLSPMFSFAAQAIIFGIIFKNNGNHFISHLIIGNVIFHYFTDAANSGMSALMVNGGIISKINVPKSIFILSKNVSCLYNFMLKLIIMFIIVAIDGVKFSPMYFSLIIPTVLMTAFNIGLGYLLSAWFVFYKDTQYLFSIFTQVLMYFSAVFYRVDRFEENMQKLFYLNPVYCYITYFRMVIIEHTIPDARFHIACIFYAVIFLILGTSVYKKNSNRFIYYF